MAPPRAPAATVKGCRSLASLPAKAQAIYSKAERALSDKRATQQHLSILDNSPTNVVNAAAASHKGFAAMCRLSRLPTYFATIASVPVRVGDVYTEEIVASQPWLAEFAAKKDLRAFLDDRLARTVGSVAPADVQQHLRDADLDAACADGVTANDGYKAVRVAILSILNGCLPVKLQSIYMKQNVAVPSASRLLLPSTVDRIKADLEKEGHNVSDEEVDVACKAWVDDTLESIGLSPGAYDLTSASCKGYKDLWRKKREWALQTLKPKLVEHITQVLKTRSDNWRAEVTETQGDKIRMLDSRRRTMRKELEAEIADLEARLSTAHRDLALLGPDEAAAGVSAEEAAEEAVMEEAVVDAAGASAEEADEEAAGGAAASAWDDEMLAALQHATAVDKGRAHRLADVDRYITELRNRVSEDLAAQHPLVMYRHQDGFEELVQAVRQHMKKRADCGVEDAYNAACVNMRFPFANGKFIEMLAQKCTTHMWWRDEYALTEGCSLQEVCRAIGRAIFCPQRPGGRGEEEDEQGRKRRRSGGAEAAVEATEAADSGKRRRRSGGAEAAVEATEAADNGRTRRRGGGAEAAVEATEAADSGRTRRRSEVAEAAVEATAAAGSGRKNARCGECRECIHYKTRKKGCMKNR